MEPVEKKIWEPWEEEMLKSLFYRGWDDEKIGLALDRTDNSIRSWRQKAPLLIESRRPPLTTDRANTHWFLYEDMWLKTHFWHRTIPFVIDVLVRSPRAIEARLYKLGLFPVGEESSHYPHYRSMLEFVHPPKRPHKELPAPPEEGKTTDPQTKLPVALANIIVVAGVAFHDDVVVVTLKRMVIEEGAGGVLYAKQPRPL